MIKQNKPLPPKKGCGKKMDALGYILCGQFDDLKNGGKQWLCDECSKKNSPQGVKYARPENLQRQEGIAGASLVGDTTQPLTDSEMKVWECKNCGIIIYCLEQPEECSCGRDYFYVNTQATSLVKRQFEAGRQSQKQIDKKEFAEWLKTQITLCDNWLMASRTEVHPFIQSFKLDLKDKLKNLEDKS